MKGSVAQLFDINLECAQYSKWWTDLNSDGETGDKNTKKGTNPGE